jgi:hypothetical protein
MLTPQSSAFLLFALLATAASAQSTKPTTSLPAPRGFHGSVVLGDHLYVFGGTSLQGTQAAAEQSTLVATIEPSGGLGPWRETAALHHPRHYIANSSVVVNDAVYVLGGSTLPSGGERLNTVTWTRQIPGGGGALEPWRLSQPFDAAGVSCLAAISTPGHLHITGGLRESSVSDQTWSLPILSDGSPGAWVAGPPLPSPLWFHSAAVVQGRAYVWGGLTRADDSRSTTTRVYSSGILANGRLEGWRTETSSLSEPFYSSPSGSAGAYLFSFSPRYHGGTNSGDIWWTYVPRSGAMQWNRIEANLEGKLFTATATDYRRGGIYLTGGRSKRDPLSYIASVHYLPLAPSAQQAAEAEQIASAPRNASVSLANTRGTGEGSPAATNAGEFPAVFHPMTTAQQIAQRGLIPVAVCFDSPGTSPSNQQANALRGMNPALLQGKCVLSYVDARETPQLAQQFGVFRAPTWIFFDSQGREKHRHVGVLTPEQLGEKAAVAAR